MLSEEFFTTARGAGGERDAGFGCHRDIQALNPFPGMILVCTTLSLHRIHKAGVEFDGITM